MDLIFTFEDGSESLAHYGVQGMKWGKWNPETQARYGRARNGTYYRKATHGTEYGKAVTNQRREYNANQSKGKQILKNVIMTPVGAHSYNTSRSRGLSRSESVTNAALGPFYSQGVKVKQIRANTTKPVISNAAKKRSEYSNSQSMAKDIAKTILLGPMPATNYNTVKAATKSRGKAAVAALLPSVAAGTATSIGVGALLHPGVVGGAANAMHILSTAQAVNKAASYGHYVPRAQSYIKNDFSPKVRKKPKN